MNDPEDMAQSGPLGGTPPGMTSPAEGTDSARRRESTESRFRVLADIGAGGMSYVQLAVAKGPGGFNKLVVLKALRDTLATDPEVSAMFRREARIAARLNHPNVIQTYEVSDEGSKQFMVLEYLEGQPLSRVIKRARDEKRIFARSHHLRVLCDSLAGLDYAHEVADFNGKPLGIVHRDVSPHNVFVTYEGQVKVLDFGIAKLANQASESAEQTEIGVVKGKIRYMAPEQLIGSRIDRRADIFAVGVMLWEALTGDKIWSQVADATVMNRVANGDFPSLRKHAPDVPAELERVCMKAMAFAREDRYRTAAEFQADLETVLQALGEDVKPREVGHFVGELFADTRADMKRIIESQLREVAMKSTPPPATRASQAAVSTTGVRQTPRTPSRGGKLLIAGAIIAGAAAIAVTLNARRAVGTTVDGPLGASTAAALAPTTDASSTEVALRIWVMPVGARLLLDDKELPSNPYNATVHRDREKHVLQASAAGYVSKLVDVSFDAPCTVTLSLEREVAKEKEAPTVGQAIRSPRVKPTATPAPSATGSPRPAGCGQPFFVDDQGIKRMRPECM